MAANILYFIYRPLELNTFPPFVPAFTFEYYFLSFVRESHLLKKINPNAFPRLKFLNFAR